MEKINAILPTIRININSSTEKIKNLFFDRGSLLLTVFMYVTLKLLDQINIFPLTE